jgi:hypothetical protein
MIRLDHMLLAVGDLPGATHNFARQLGFDARTGGVHPGRGTYNSLVHLGSAYLELIGVNDASADRARPFLQFLDLGGDGAYQFALAVDDLEVARDAVQATGLQPDTIKDGSRQTPSGDLLRWRACALNPGRGTSAELPMLPFLIQWVVDGGGREWFGDRVRLTVHPAGWTSARALLIASPEPGRLADEYAGYFGWDRTGDARDRINLGLSAGDAVNSSLGRSAAVVVVGGKVESADPVDRLIAEAASNRLARGAGALGMSIGSANVGQTVAWLRRAGVRVTDSIDGRRAVIDPVDSNGAVLEIVSD